MEQYWKWNIEYLSILYSNEHIKLEQDRHENYVSLSFSQYDSNGKVFYDLYIFNQPFCANACQFQSDTTLSAAAWIFPISI